MTRALVATRIRFQKAVEAREAGQGTLEYLGIVIIAGLLIAAIIGAIEYFDLQTKLQEQLDDILP